MARPKTPDLLKPSEVAALLKISKQMVYWYIRRGVIPAGRVKGSRLLRIKRLDLNKAIAEWFKPRAAAATKTESTPPGPEPGPVAGS